MTSPTALPPLHGHHAAASCHSALHTAPLHTLPFSAYYLQTHTHLPFCWNKTITNREEGHLIKIAYLHAGKEGERRAGGGGGRSCLLFSVACSCRRSAPPVRPFCLLHSPYHTPHTCTHTTANLLPPPPAYFITSSTHHTLTFACIPLHYPPPPPWEHPFSVTFLRGLFLLLPSLGLPSAARAGLRAAASSPFHLCHTSHCTCLPSASHPTLPTTTPATPHTTPSTTPTHCPPPMHWDTCTPFHTCPHTAGHTLCLFFFQDHPPAHPHPHLQEQDRTLSDQETAAPQ